MFVKVIFLVLLAGINVRSQSAPFLVATPAKSEFTAGENVSFYCSYVSPGDVFMYYLNLNGYYASSSKNAEMIKSNLDPRESGNYTCQCAVGISDLTPNSNVVSLTVVEACNCVEDHTVACEDGTCVCKLGFSGSDCGTGSAPVLTAKPAKSVYEQGTNITFTCSYIAPNDVDVYRYFFNGKYIRNLNEVKLIISNLEPSYSGNFTCDAVLKWEGLTPRSKIVTLHVAEPCNCVEDHTVACEDGTCVCKLGFSGSDCGTGSEPDYYVYEGENLNFQETKQVCRSKGQIMAMPKTAAEFGNFQTLVDGKTDASVWIGLRRSNGRDFVYANGEKLVYSNWNDLQPDNGQLMEACVRVNGANGQWWDDQCATTYPYVCQFEGTIRINPVSYEAYKDEVSYYNAGASCQEKGGDLAMPTSDVENENIKAAFEKKLPDKYWIGVQRKLANWRWLDGELQTFSFNAWLDGEPDNGEGGEYCAMYDISFGGWADTRCRLAGTSVHVCQSRKGICMDKKPRACYFKIHGLSEDVRREYCKKAWPKDRCQKSCGLCGY